MARMLKAIHASEDKDPAQEKAKAVIKKLEAQELRKADAMVRKGFGLGYYDFPDARWRRIRAKNPLEGILREVRRLTRVVGAFFRTATPPSCWWRPGFVTSAVRAGEHVAISTWIYSKRWRKKKSLPEP